ncbi:MBL fold metallo-hydrolase [Methylobacterium frigidaeris]|uniref:Metallo-beta-lactamase domain-containing protein n=1 Tax=Methylobacterium frigidaeris TaxID=2038277 RepID=A0AA37H973_9HYPH|nr:MBL fold metallo-hydrolase [Methylobacterium frigidaeris]GJD61176.1 hypothetical protein MPEAHAMD_1316 [Methylobacterium frigidaeris]
MTIRLDAPNRRGLMLGAAAAAVTAGLPGAAGAKAPMLRSQSPYYYRFTLGDAEATMVSDGTLPLGDPHANFLGLTPAEMDAQLNSNFLPLSNAVLEQNILILNTGSKLVLFDTGMGSLKLFGPTTGKLLTTMRQAGIDPKDIDAVVMSHAHVDHCGGCVADDGTPHFPNAQYYISQADFDYWTDPAKVPASFGAFLDTARKNLLPIRDRLVFVKDGQEFLPGIQALAAPGHSVGHMIFMITSGKDSLCYLGDLTHHPVLLMEKPLTEFAYDTDPKQSAQTRLRMLTMLAKNRIPVLAYHFAWPGIGHVADNGQGGFRYYPQAMKMEL